MTANEYLQDKLQSAAYRVQELENQFEEVKLALEYYADEKIYAYGDYGYQSIASIDLDKGGKARKALNGVLTKQSQIEYVKLLEAQNKLMYSALQSLEKAIRSQLQNIENVLNETEFKSP